MNRISGIFGSIVSRPRSSRRQKSEYVPSERHLLLGQLRTAARDETVLPQYMLNDPDYEEKDIQAFHDRAVSQQLFIINENADDLDMLRVFASYPTPLVNDKRVLWNLAKALREAGHRKVFPVLESANIVDGIRFSKKLTINYVDGVDEMRISHETMDALRCACVLSTPEAAAYMIADPVRAMEVTSERSLTDYRQIIHLMKSMAENESQPLAEGIL